MECRKCGEQILSGEEAMRRTAIGWQRFRGYHQKCWDSLTKGRAA